MTIYTSDEVTYYKLRCILQGMSNEDIEEMYQHVKQCGFHADTEFKELCLEGRVSIDEFIDALTTEIDERRRSQKLL